MEEELKIKGEAEINQALHEFELKEAMEQAKREALNKKEDKASTMVEWVIKISKGKVKDEDQANIVLLGIVVLCISASLIVIFFR